MTPGCSSPSSFDRQTGTLAYRQIFHDSDISPRIFHLIFGSPRTHPRVKSPAGTPVATITTGAQDIVPLLPQMMVPTTDAEAIAANAPPPVSEMDMKSPNDGRPARVVHQKTPEQKQTLEDAFQANNFPDDAGRKALAAATGLSEAQISTWFNHRRRRERKEGGALVRQDVPEGPSSVPAKTRGSAIDTERGLATVSDDVDGSEGHDDVDIEGLEAGDRSRLVEYEEVLESAKSALEEAFREDGPPLGIEFDDLPDAGTQLRGSQGGKGKRRKSAGDDPDFAVGGGGKRAKTGNGARTRPTVAPGALSGEELQRLRAEEELRAATLTEQARLQVEKLEASIRREQERLMKEREKQDIKMAKEREKELARLEAERRRYLDRVLKEQKKEEERRAKEEARLRALQEKEEKRLAAQRERELKAEERRREKEEKKRLRDLTNQERRLQPPALRMRRRVSHSVRDDLDLEWEALVEQYRAEHNVPADVDIPASEGTAALPGFPPLPARPPFPPPSIELRPAVIIPNGENLISPTTAGDLMAVCAMMETFAPVMGIEPVNLQALAQAIAAGTRSEILGKIHIALLRVLQADAEEAHAAGDGGTTAGTSGADSKTPGDQGHTHVISPGARLLKEAWAWGFDVDVWRAHLNLLTWPEVARELAIAAGLGRRRPQRTRGSGKMPMGKKGEDVVVGEAQDGLKLQMPARLGMGTVKGAAWLVLKDAGYEGLHVEEIARRIQSQGLRDLRTSKTPETSVAGALAKDVLFERVAKATFALQSIRAYYDRLGVKPAKSPRPDDAEKEEEEEDGGEENKDKQKAESPVGGNKEDGVNEEEEEEDEENEEEEEDQEEDREEEARRQRDEAHLGEEWVAALLDTEYDSLPLDQRVAMLMAFCQLAMESPTVRFLLDRRDEEYQRLKRAMWEDVKAEASLVKQRRQAEQAAKLRAQAEEAQRELQRLQDIEQNGVHAPPQEPAPLGDEPLKKEEMHVVEGAQNGVVQRAEAKTETAVEVQSTAGTQPEANNEGGAPDEAVLAAEAEALAKRAAARVEAARREMEANVIRAEPLGMDRRYNSYWKFDFAGRNDVFVESHIDGAMQVIGSLDALEALIEALNPKGPREGALHASLVRILTELRHKNAEKEDSTNAGGQGSVSPWGGLADVSACFEVMTPALESVRKSIASSTLKAFVPGESPTTTFLKSHLLAIRSALPSNGLVAEGDFDEFDWSEDVKLANNVETLRRCLGQLEVAISSAVLPRDFKTKLLVKGAWIPTGVEVATAMPGSTAADVLLSPAGVPAQPPVLEGTEDNGNDQPEAASATGPDPLAWLPPTIGALAMRITALDAAIKYDGTHAARDSAPGYHYVLRPGRLQNAENGLVRGLKLERHGNVHPALLPEFPYVLLFAPRTDFSFPRAQFQADVASGIDSTMKLESKKAIGFRGRGRGRGRSGGRGFPKGAQRGKGGRGGGTMAGSKRRFGGSGHGHRSALGKELGARSDSERHYGSDLDEADDEDDDEFMSAAAPYNGSLGPSAAPSTAEDDEDDEAKEDKTKAGSDYQASSSEDEEISDAEEVSLVEEDSEVDVD